MTAAGTPAQFIAKWSRVELSERAASQEHFIDLCRLLGQPTPAEHDATGAEYTFEKGVKLGGAGILPAGGARGAARGASGDGGSPAEGDGGFADVWWRGKFGWEYKRKGKYKDLAQAYAQLCRYREALENPPLLIVSDIARTEIHTNFTGTRKDVHTIPLEQLDQPEKLDLIRRAFTDPESFKPKQTAAKITETAAKQFAEIANRLRERGHDPHDAAHFLMKCMFCLFAEDVQLLPNKLFSKLLDRSKDDPSKLKARLADLFDRMRTGGDFGSEEIAYFNGGLFDEAPPLDLRREEIIAMQWAAAEDWAAVEPAIFGTLFERSLDPNKRAQIGAHYTSREDIMLIVEPVVMQPLRREWAAVRAACDTLREQVKAGGRRAIGKSGKALKQSPALAKLEKTLEDFTDRLAAVRILDPACGSGNFLYVAIQQLLGLEKEVSTYAATIGLGLFPRVRPTQLHGIEINPYAAELAQVVIWIGYLQWMRDNGYPVPRDPILEPLQTIECRDAILDLTIPTKPQAATWPEADFIIGNPPFLGSSRFGEYGLPEEYVRSMGAVYKLHGKSDLCCYWFARSADQLSRHATLRVGLLATQSIRHGGSREVLERLADDGRIFLGWSNRPWVVDGAAVRVSIVGFDRGTDGDAVLDAVDVSSINPDLTAGVDLTRARPLSSNRNLSFEGIQKGGPFDIADHELARQMIGSPNPHGSSNCEVVLRRFNARSLLTTRHPEWVIDFGPECPLEQAARFERPFEYVATHVKPVRVKNKNPTLREHWWIHKCPRPELRAAVSHLRRMLVTARVSEHRLWAWLDFRTHPDSRLFVFSRDDDYFFGLLHSSIHEVWSHRIGAIHGKGNDPTYNNTKCFETFPLPWPPGKENTRHIAYLRISEAAAELNEQRERWLNPPEWIGPLAEMIDRRDDFSDVPGDLNDPASPRALIRQSAIMAEAARDPRLKRRTLTNLYNERPTWLRLAHEKLDRAVLAAYAAVDPAGEWAENWAEVWVETGAGEAFSKSTADAARARESTADTAVAHDTDAAAAHGKDDTDAAAAHGGRDAHKARNGLEAHTTALAQRRKETDGRVLANLLRMNLERAGAAGSERHC